MENTTQPSENVDAGSEPTNQAAKRDRSSDDDDGTRRVAQRTDNNDAAVSIKKLLFKKLQSEDKNVVFNALKSLVDAIKDDDEVKRAENQAEFVKFGGHSLVVVAMKKYTDSRNVLCGCVRVLARATYKNDQVKGHVADVDGIEAIVDAMKKYPEDAGIMDAGFSALMNLSGVEDNANLMVNELCITPFIVGRMKHFLALGKLDLISSRLVNY